MRDLVLTRNIGKKDDGDIWNRGEIAAKRVLERSLVDRVTCICKSVKKNGQKLGYLPLTLFAPAYLSVSKDPPYVLGFGLGYDSKSFCE